MPALADLAARWRADQWNATTGTLADMVGSRDMVRTANAFTASNDATANGKQVLTANGTGGFLANVAFPEIEGDYTALFFVNRVSTGDTWQLMAGAGANMVRFPGPATIYTNNSTTTFVSATPNWLGSQAGKWASIIMRVENGVAVTWNVFELAKAVTAYTVAFPGTCTKLYLMCRYNVTTFITNGSKLGEVALWNRQLTDLEVLQANAYLGWYWAYQGGQ